MIDKYEGFNIVKMAEYLKHRRNTRKDTLLVLGARAGGLFRSSSFSKVLSTFSSNFDRLLHVQKFAECFNILRRDMLSQGEVDAIVKAALQEVSFSEADYCVAQLVKRGYFNTLITTNVDDILEQACIKAEVELDLFVPHAAVERLRTQSTSRNLHPLLIKPFGDLISREYSINNRTYFLRKAEYLRKIMNDERNMPVLLVGLDPIWDQDIFSLLFPRKGPVWYVDEERPLVNSPLERYLQKCDVQYVTGDEERYTSFFLSLYRNVVGDSDPARRVKPQSTQSTALESTSDLMSSLNAQTWAVRQREQEVPKPRVTITLLYARLPGALLAYYHAETMPLVQYKIENNGLEAVKVVLSAEIEAYSTPAIDTLEVQPQSQRICYQLPRLDTDKASLLTKSVSVPAHIQVCYLKEGVELPYNTREFHVNFQESVELPYDIQKFRVSFMARNMMRWAVPDVKNSGKKLPLLQHLAAWVTPGTNPVKIMFRNAIYYHPRKTLNGYPSQYSPDVPRSQVKAIFRALKEMGKIMYVAANFIISSEGNDVIQTIRLPDECLRECEANSIEGAVLYASLIECASLEPVIILQKDHAFVGWKTGKNGNEYEFLETTMTLNASFDEAFAEGMNAYAQLKRKRLFEREPFDKDGFAYLLDIKQLRNVGIHPMVP